MSLEDGLPANGVVPELIVHTLAAPRTDQVSQPPHGVILGQLVQYAGLAQARQDMPSVLVFLLGNAGLCPIQEHLSRDSLLLAEARSSAIIRGNQVRGAAHVHGVLEGRARRPMLLGDATRVLLHVLVPMLVSFPAVRKCIPRLDDAELAGYSRVHVPRMPLAPPFLRFYLPFSCRRLTAFFVVGIAPIETSRSNLALDGVLFLVLFVCHRQLSTPPQTAADARRLFPQNLESRAEDNYPVPDYPDRPDRPVSACALKKARKKSTTPISQVIFRCDEKL